MSHRFGKLPVVLLAGILGLAAQPAAAQDDLRETVDRTVEARQETQRDLDAWAVEKAALEQRYRTARDRVAWLGGRRDEEAARLTALEARLAELERRLAEADRLEASVQDSLMGVLARLEETVDRGLPFLPRERALRLESLRAELDRPDVEAAEKLRRLLEALQVEAGYAASVEIYQDEIAVAGTPLHADILRLGRLSLFWRTPDGRRAGCFDRAAGGWVELGAGPRRAIARAMEMAARTRPVELLALPLGRIVP